MPDDSKIVLISDRTAKHRSSQADPAIVEQLKSMLAQAESGDLQALFAVAWLAPSNSIMSGWQGADRAAFTLLGGVQQCLTEYTLKEFQRRN